MNDTLLSSIMAPYANVEVRLPSKATLKTLPAAHLRAMFKDCCGLPEGALNTWCHEYIESIDDVRLGNIYHGLLLAVDNDLYVLSTRQDKDTVVVAGFHINKHDVLLAYCMTIMVKERVHAFCNRMLQVNANRILTRQMQFYGRGLYCCAVQRRLAA